MFFHGVLNAGCVIALTITTRSDLMSPFTFLLLSFISSFPSQCMDHCRVPSNSSVFLMPRSLPLIQSVLNAAAKLMVRLLLSSLISSFVHFPTYTLASTSWLVPKYYKVLLLILFWLISATSVICRPHAVTSLRPLQSSLSRPICLTAENIRPILPVTRSRAVALIGSFLWNQLPPLTPL